MPGSTLAQLLPAGGGFESGLHGSPTTDGLASGTPVGSAVGSAVSCEPPAEPPLLRGYGGGLAGSPVAADQTVEPFDARVQEIVAQLLPIQSRSALFSSFEREANSTDPAVRAAYASVWADLVLGVARMSTRRARIRATMAPVRRSALRGRG
jgi:hypothetical protein